MGRHKSHPELIYKTNRHCCYDLQYHMVFVTKYRHPVIKGDVEIRLKEIIQQLLKDAKCTLIECNACEDHMHILFEATPRTSLSILANNIKTVTSRRIKQEFAEELKQYYGKPYFWSQSYFVGAVSERTKTAVQQYIQQQKDSD